MIHQSYDKKTGWRKTDYLHKYLIMEITLAPILTYLKPAHGHVTFNL